MALPQAAAGSRGDSKSEEEKAVAVSYIRRRVSVAAVKGQRLSLLGRLEVLGPGTAAAAHLTWTWTVPTGEDSQ